MNEMRKLVEGFSAQLKEALENAGRAELKPAAREIRNVLITGLGGSGIGGTIVSELLFNQSPVPVLVNKDYFIPAFVGENTLVVACSYSGNTEETIRAMEAAIKRNARVVCITSGGKMAELANASQLDLLKLPGGMPPRACLGYSLTMLMFTMSHFKLTTTDVKSDVTRVAGLIREEKNQLIKDAEKIAAFLNNKIPVIYSVEGYSGVAVRFRQQLNENSKVLCWHHVIPEMNHNELVGWAGGNDGMAVILLRNETDYSRSQARLEICKSVFSKYTPHVMELWSKGESHLEKTLYLVHLTDLVSVILAEMRNVDAMEIAVINHLKGELSKI